MMKLTDIPPDLARARIMRKSDAAAFLGLDMQMLRRLERDGKMPTEVRFSERVSGYRLGDIVDLSDRLAGVAA